jgi:thiamine kinase-like enzyme
MAKEVLVEDVEKIKELALKVLGTDAIGDVARLGGMTNHTYKVTMLEEAGEHPYILQRINTNIFKNAEGLMGNVKGVTEHIREKLCGCEDAKRLVLHFLYTPEGKNFYVDSEGGFWRMYHFVDRSVTYNFTDDPKVLYSAGWAFGNFQMQLADYDASTLCETIPGFHNTKQRIATLLAHVEEDKVGRVALVEKEINYIKENIALASKLTEMLQAHELPLRVTHNDTKCNNVLFDEATNGPLAVIDLDTIMPGLACHDFGDAIRFASNTAAEDEKDLSKVSCDLGLYEAFAKGFIEQTASALTKTELSCMALGAFTMTFECGVRFLDDYISGDVYFKIKHPEHNLDRARCQLALAKDMQSKFDKMNAIIESIAASI